jgi:hypothetical protein
MKNLVFFFLMIFSLISCSQNEKEEIIENEPSLNRTAEKIQVLNLGTFHFGYTPDANTVEFDEHNDDNKRQAHEIAKKISEFKPTIILVEREPEFNHELSDQYLSYVKNPKVTFDNPTEIELLAFEVGRLSGTEMIFGIDHQMGYNYNIGGQINNSVDKLWYDLYFSDPEKFYPSLNLSQQDWALFEKLRMMNNDIYLDFMIAVNADMLTHAGTDGNFEGADEAAKFYQRNMRMYTEMNRLDIKPTDRVFILMGASHTAFFRDFLSRSPKYEMVDTFDYLK